MNPRITGLGLALCLALATPLPAVFEEKKPDRSDPSVLASLALEVDREVGAFYRARGVEVPADADASTLLRRTYLVVAGRIPTLEEARAYLADTSADRHARLVGQLIASPGYRSHMTNWLFDLLRVREHFTSTVSAAPYLHYLRQSIEANKPWDQLTSELLTAEGQGWNGAPEVGYYVRDKGMPLDNTANTMRIFAGTRMECAQCHDHPYEEWSRRDFFELAAFFHGSRSLRENVHREAMRETRGDRDAGKVSRHDRELHDFVRTVAGDAHYLSLAGGGLGHIPLPEDYQYRDGDPGEKVGARSPFGPSLRMSTRRDGDDGRQRFVAWLVDPENPRFAQTIANRMWQRVMGRGLYEPVDEFIEPEKTLNPRLMHTLTGLMRKLDYDLRAFQQVLLLTRTFRFATNPQHVPGNAPESLAGRQLKRMTAEQIWDSLVGLARGNPDATVGKPVLDQRVRFRGRIIAAGETMGRMQEDLLAIDRLPEYLRYLRGMMKNDGKAEGPASMNMMDGGGRKKGGLIRASELPAPAPGDHFLRRFGQSDREVIEGGSVAGTVPQMLALLNGEVQQLLVENPKSHIFRRLKEMPGEEERLEAMFLATLSRHPTPDEEDMMLLAILESGEEDGWRNILSALLCTHEFLFVR